MYQAKTKPTQASSLARLGKHKAGKAFLYISRLSEVELPILERLIAGSVKEVRSR